MTDLPDVASICNPAPHQDLDPAFLEKEFKA